MESPRWTAGHPKGQAAASRRRTSWRTRATRHAEEIGHLGKSALDPALGAACLAVADAVQQGTEPSTGLDAMAGPFCGAVIDIQLSARSHRAFDPERQDVLARAGADRLRALVRKVAAQ